MLLVKDVRLYVRRDASTHPTFVVEAVHVPTKTVATSDSNASEFKAKVQALTRLRELVEPEKDGRVG